MPTAQTLEWKSETVEAKPWPKAEAHPASLRKFRAESPRNGRIVGESDINQGLKAEIEQARRILELEDDWDGEGSPGYSEETFNRAVAFLTTYVEGLWESCGMPLPIPRIGPGPDGSIDLHWKQPSWELLVNIPTDPNEAASYSGEDDEGHQSRGFLGTEKFNSRFARTWLTN